MSENKVWVFVAAVVESEGRFAIVGETKQDARGMYNLPSGKIEVGESLGRAAIRETKEETGLDIELNDRPLIGVYQRPMADNGCNMIMFAFAAHTWQGEFITNDAHPEIEWRTLEQLHELKTNGKLRAPYVIEIIEDYIAGKRQSADVIEVINY